MHGGRRCVRRRRGRRGRGRRGRGARRAVLVATAAGEQRRHEDAREGGKQVPLAQHASGSAACDGRFVRCRPPGASAPRPPPGGSLPPMTEWDALDLDELAAARASLPATIMVPRGAPEREPGAQFTRATAAGWARRFVEEHPDDPRGASLHGLIEKEPLWVELEPLLANEDWEPARTLLDRVLELDPDDASARFNRASALRNLGEPQAGAGRVPGGPPDLRRPGDLPRQPRPHVRGPRPAGGGHQGLPAHARARARATRSPSRASSCSASS